MFFMDKIITIIGLVFAFGIVLLISMGGISNDTKLPIVVLFMLIAGYSLTRIGSKEKKSGKHTGR